MERDVVVDRRRHSFFVVDNVAILEYAERIGSNALALYVILACHARAETGECYPSIKRLMRLMGRSRPVVFEAIEILKAHGRRSVRSPTVVINMIGWPRVSCHGGSVLFSKNTVLGGCYRRALVCVRTKLP